jgi:hypothetical protein
MPDRDAGRVTRDAKVASSPVTPARHASRITRHDTTIPWALGCAAAFSLLVVVGLIAYLWTL